MRDEVIAGREATEVAEAAPEPEPGTLRASRYADA